MVTELLAVVRYRAQIPGCPSFGRREDLEVLVKELQRALGETPVT